MQVVLQQQSIQFGKIEIKRIHKLREAPSERLNVYTSLDESELPKIAKNKYKFLIRPKKKVPYSTNHTPKNSKWQPIDKLLQEEVI